MSHICAEIAEAETRRRSGEMANLDRTSCHFTMVHPGLSRDQQLSGSEPAKSSLPVRQSHGRVTVPHGCQHRPHVRHRSIQLIRNRTVNIS
jgi:hypothetical protein